jgi:peptide/nickel transport system permease protein
VLGKRARARFAKNRGALVGLGIVVGVALFALAAPLVSGRDPLASDFARGVGQDHGPIGPCAAFPFGTDRIFRDVFIRVAYGARLSLLIGVAATAIATTIGGAVGIVAGWYEGDGARVPWAVIAAAAAAIVVAGAGHPRIAAIGFAVAIAVLAARASRATTAPRGARVDVDSLLMRLVDIGLSFPFLLLVMAIGAALEQTTVTTIFLTLGLTGWLGTARILRAKTMQVRSLDFIVAARALGQSTPRILLSHVLPNVAGPLVVVATISVAHMIIAESALSFLGVGISPPTPTWGRMLEEGRDSLEIAPWMIVAPGVAILLTVLGFNLLGEGLRDALDPKER